MKKYKIIIKTILLVMLASVMLHAGNQNRTGTGGAAQLLIPVGARGIAMGNANIASSTGVEALFWNPANVASMKSSVDVMFSHMNYIADIGVEYGAVAASVEGFGVLGFHVKSLSIGDIDVTTTEQPDGTGQKFTPQMLTAGVTFSRQLTENIAVGVTASYISETLDEVSASGVAFNVGVAYNNLANIRGLNFGIAVKNLGPQMEFAGSGLNIEAESGDLQRPPGIFKAESAAFELPSTFELGFSYTPFADDENSLLLSGLFQNQNFSADEYKLGGEYSYNDMFFVRGGYNFAPQIESEEYIYGLTAGLGIKYLTGGLELKIDYAYRDVDVFDSNHVFAVAIGF
jgi:hypothetical protein